jgi:hypothetical protein
VLIHSTAISSSFEATVATFFKGVHWDGIELWLIAERLEKGRFVRSPIIEGAMTLMPAQFSVLI